MLLLYDTHIVPRSYSTLARRRKQLRHHARETERRGELADELVLVAHDRLQVEAGRRGVGVQEQLLDIGELRPNGLHEQRERVARRMHLGGIEIMPADAGNALVTQRLLRARGVR